MDFIDDENTVSSRLRWYPYPVCEASYIIDRIIGGGIQFMYVERPHFIEGHTGFTLITGLCFRGYICAVNGFCKYPGTSSLTYTPWTTEKISMANIIIFNGIPQGDRNGFLPYYR